MKKIILNSLIFTLIFCIWVSITVVLIKATRSATNPGSDWAPNELYVWADETLEATKRNALVDKSMWCPAGFTLITNQNNIIWCIQNTLRPTTKNCNQAIMDCYDTYGGRLPSASEIKIATLRYTSQLTDELTQREWIDIWYNNNWNIYCAWLREDGIFWWSASTTFSSYRCFIPK